MDPNANLREQRYHRAAMLRLESLDAHGMSPEGIASAQLEYNRHAASLMELSEALDTWLQKGGNLPEAWRVHWMRYHEVAE